MIKHRICFHQGGNLYVSNWRLPCHHHIPWGENALNSVRQSRVMRWHGTPSVAARPLGRVETVRRRMTVFTPGDKPAPDEGAETSARRRTDVAGTAAHAHASECSRGAAVSSDIEISPVGQRGYCLGDAGRFSGSSFLDGTAVRHELRSCPHWVAGQAGNAEARLAASRRQG